MKNIKEIVTQQKDFFLSGATKDWKQRRKYLLRLRKCIRENWLKIRDGLKKDLNKSKCEAYISEYALVMNELNLMIKKIHKWSKPKRVRRVLGTIFSKCYVIKEPLGNVLIYVPWNYPFQLALIPFIDAIAAGNTVVIYLSPNSPNTNIVIKEIINSLFPESYAVAIEHADVPYCDIFNAKYDYIFFTGSERVGKIVANEAMKTLTPLTLELGGMCPCIVDETANINASVRRVVRAKGMNAGQTCVAPNYVLVHKSVKDIFLNKLITQIQYSYGDDPNSDLLPKIINSQRFSHLKKLLDGQKVIYGGKLDETTNKIGITLVEVNNFSDPIMQEEIFGPILPILEFVNINQLIANLRLLEKPLALYIFSSNKQNINLLLHQLSSGDVCINDAAIHIFNPNLPFGGVGSSGMGAYHGLFGFDTFSHLRSLIKTSTKVDLKKLMYPPWTEEKLKILDKIL